VESDVRCAALAESRFGVGANLESFRYVGIGTGVACAFVRRGEVHRGTRGNAIILGTASVEQRSAGRALNRQLGPDLESAFGDVRNADAVDSAATDIGESIGIVVNALDPGAVVIGGGLGMNAEFFDRVGHAIRRVIYADDTRRLPIEMTALRGNAGVIGAALAGWDRLVAEY